jgi:hypothetical protein
MTILKIFATLKQRSFVTVWIFFLMLLNTAYTTNNRDEKVDAKQPFLLRSTSQSLDRYQAQAMLNKYGFCDRARNPGKKNFKNEFLKQQIDGENIVIDKTSGLMWQQGGSSDRILYREAEKRIKELNAKRYAGFNDWRLPTLEEAMSLMEPEKKNGNIYIDPVFDKTQRWIWTSDPISGSSDRFWVIDFDDGECYSYASANFSYYVRAVRSGQSSAG